MRVWQAGIRTSDDVTSRTRGDWRTRLVLWCLALVILTLATPPRALAQVHDNPIRGEVRRGTMVKYITDITRPTGKTSETTYRYANRVLPRAIRVEQHLFRKVVDSPILPVDVEADAVTRYYISREGNVDNDFPPNTIYGVPTTETVQRTINGLTLTCRHVTVRGDFKNAEGLPLLLTGEYWFADEVPFGGLVEKQIRLTEPPEMAQTLTTRYIGQVIPATEPPPETDFAEAIRWYDQALVFPPWATNDARSAIRASLQRSLLAGGEMELLVHYAAQGSDDETLQTEVAVALLRAEYLPEAITAASCADPRHPVAAFLKAWRVKNGLPAEGGSDAPAAGAGAGAGTEAAPTATGGDAPPVVPDAATLAVLVNWLATRYPEPVDPTKVYGAHPWLSYANLLLQADRFTDAEALTARFSGPCLALERNLAAAAWRLGRTADGDRHLAVLLASDYYGRTNFDFSLAGDLSSLLLALPADHPSARAISDRLAQLAAGAAATDPTLAQSIAIRLLLWDYRRFENDPQSRAVAARGLRTPGLPVTAEDVLAIAQYASADIAYAGFVLHWDASEPPSWITCVFLYDALDRQGYKLLYDELAQRVIRDCLIKKVVKHDVGPIDTLTLTNTGDHIPSLMTHLLKTDRGVLASAIATQLGTDRFGALALDTYLSWALMRDRNDMLEITNKAIPERLKARLDDFTDALETANHHGMAQRLLVMAGLDTPAQRTRLALHRGVYLADHGLHDELRTLLAADLPPDHADLDGYYDILAWLYLQAGDATTMQSVFDSKLFQTNEIATIMGVAPYQGRRRGDFTVDLLTAIEREGMSVAPFERFILEDPEKKSLQRAFFTIALGRAICAR